MNELRTVEKVFEGQALSAYLWEGAPVWVAKELGRVMGYSDEGKALIQLLRREWKEDVIEGTDYEILEGERLALFKNHHTSFTRLVDGDLGGITQLVDKSNNDSSGFTRIVDPRTPSLLVLKESGFHAVCLKTDKPVGVRLRRWLATEVMPSLVRTGSYQRPTSLIESGTVKAVEAFLEGAPKVIEVLTRKAAAGSKGYAKLLLAYQSELKKIQEKGIASFQQPLGADLSSCEDFQNHPDYPAFLARWVSLFPDFVSERAVMGCVIGPKGMFKSIFYRMRYNRYYERIRSILAGLHVDEPYQLERTWNQFESEYYYKLTRAS